MKVFKQVFNRYNILSDWLAAQRPSKSNSLISHAGSEVKCISTGKSVISSSVALTPDRSITPLSATLRLLLFICHKSQHLITTLTSGGSWCSCGPVKVDSGLGPVGHVHQCFALVYGGQKARRPITDLVIRINEKGLVTRLEESVRTGWQKHTVLDNHTTVNLKTTWTNLSSLLCNMFDQVFDQTVFIKMH